MFGRVFCIVGMVSCFIFPSNVNAAIYKKNEADGTVTFSNQPLDGGKKVNLNDYPVSTYSKDGRKSKESQGASSSQELTQEIKPEKKDSPEKPAEINPAEYYKKFEMASPKDKQTFQNQQKIPVLVTVNPDFLPGSKVQVYVDGSPYGEPAPKSSFTLNKLDRGIHTVYAELIDKNGAVIRTTSTVTIYVHHASLGITGSYEAKILDVPKVVFVRG
jgi:hypothetical protein